MKGFKKGNIFLKFMGFQKLILCTWSNVGTMCQATNSQRPDAKVMRHLEVTANAKEGV